MNGGSFSDLSAFDVKAYVSLTFFPLTPDCLRSDRPLSGAILHFSFSKRLKNLKMCVPVKKASFIHIVDVS